MTLKIFNRALGQSIRKQRLKARLRQYELANKINVSANYLSRIEAGKISLRAYTVYLIANALEIGIATLYRGVRRNGNGSDKVKGVAEGFTPNNLGH